MKAVLVSRARDGRPISYTELTGNVHAIHFSPEDHALHHMLGQVSEEEDAAGRGMLSVIVIHKEGDMMPGPGFFVLAKRLGRDKTDRVRCWSEETTKVYANS
jgi:hypothetical protein